MMLYENSSDRTKQEVACDKLQAHLNKMGVMATFKQSSDPDKPPYDAYMSVNGHYTGVVEVKNLTYESTEVEKWRGIMIKRDQIADQWKLFNRKGKWIKEVVILVTCTDNVFYVINLKDIHRLWDESEKVPQHMVKDDHGKKSSKKKHRFIKQKHWDKFQ